MAKRKKEEPKLVDIPRELLDRARREGVSDDQIKSLGTEENIKAYCDQISPQTNPDSLPKVDIPEPKKTEPMTELVPDMVPVAKDSIRDEKQTIESLVRKMNIKFNTPDIQQVTKTVVFDCKTKQIVKAEYSIKKG